IRWFRIYTGSPKKLLFGSDWPLADIKDYVSAVKNAVPPEEWDDVFYKNAERVFPRLKKTDSSLVQ
ncbi:amidohydrolase, partial [bacterium]|nr:amidohydrolase [bacterium]